MSMTEDDGCFEGSYVHNYTFKPVNPFVNEVADFTIVYIFIAMCLVIFTGFLIVTIIFCCLQPSDYPQDRLTANCWIVSIRSTTPHKQPPLDFTKLESQYLPILYSSGDYYISHHHVSNFPTLASHQPLKSSQEYLEMHLIRSEI